MSNSFCKAAASFYIPAHNVWESISPRPHPHWLLSVFLITGIPDGVKWHCCGFDLHFFNVVEHSFMCLLTLCTAFLVNCLFKSFALFKMGLSFHCWVVQVFFILGISLSQIQDLENFSPSQNGLSFHFMDGVLWSTNIFNFLEVQLTYLFFCNLCLLVSYPRNYCLT